MSNTYIETMEVISSSITECFNNNCIEFIDDKNRAKGEDKRSFSKRAEESVRNFIMGGIEQLFSILNLRIHDLNSLHIFDKERLVEYGNINYSCNDTIKHDGWFDLGIVLVVNGDAVFFPYNIKITNGKSADNLSSIPGFLFAVTGKKPDKTNFDSYGKCVMDSDNPKDYGIIIASKKTFKIIATSLRHFDKIVSNGNNLPCQIRFDQSNVTNTIKSNEDLYLILYKSLMLKTTKPKPFMRAIEFRLGISYFNRSDIKYLYNYSNSQPCDVLGNPICDTNCKEYKVLISI